MATSPIYTTGDGTHKQYARRDDGLWFSRVKRQNAPGWSAWGIVGMMTPIGLYKDQHAGTARLPARKIGGSDAKVTQKMWYDAE